MKFITLTKANEFITLTKANEFALENDVIDYSLRYNYNLRQPI